MEQIKMMLSELRPEFSFDDSVNFIEDGYLDSFDIVALISTLEEHFSIVIDGLDIIPDNFISYNAIIELVKKSGGEL